MKFLSPTLIFLLFPALAFGLSPMDFNKGFPLRLEPERPIQHVVFTLDVYASGFRSDLGDMRIFNGDGETIPMHLRSRSPSPAPKFQKPETFLPVFRLDANASNGNQRDDYRMQVTTSATGTVISVQRQENAESRHGALLVDATGIHDPIGALGVDLNTPLPRLLSVSVEGSDDLSSWHAAGTAALARMEHPNGKILQNRIPLQDRNWKYYLIKTDGDLSLLGPVTAIPEEETQAPASSYHWTRLEGKKVEDGLYEYHLPETLPVFLLDLSEADENIVLDVTLLVPSEKGTEKKWRKIKQGSLFKLNMDEKSIRSDPISISGPMGHFRLAIKGGLAPLRIGWIPHELVFMPKGSAPFLLAVGNVTLGPEDLLAPMVAGIEPDQIGRASLEPAKVLAGDQTAKLPTDYKTLILWGILGLGVALMAIMAWSLVKKSKSVSP
ncbi:DUF3999 domain-containing protein [Desulfosarcina sp. OttesenSCG-928-A07]|nr:DUF3999 domain-containing protein [Desulfosarcina sp. OttesenSCG-928-A07]